MSNYTGSTIIAGTSSLNSASSVVIANSKELLSFNEILQLFNCAISEQQAWAVLYETILEFRNLFQLIKSNSNGDETLELRRLLVINQDSIDLNSIYFSHDGCVYLQLHKNAIVTKAQRNSRRTNSAKPNENSSQYFFFNYLNYMNMEKNSSSASNVSSENILNFESGKHKLEAKVLKSIAYLIYDALDYGNKFDTEPDLETSLSDLLLFISGHSNEKQMMSEDDEGYENEDDESTSITLEKALQICVNSASEADYHYRAVCRALYAQANELKAFLAKIEDSKNILLNNGKDESLYCFEVLDKTDWAKLWMQVIHELRNGIKLRKVSTNELKRHIEYELTPFEILLDQIRSRRYSLRKVAVGLRPFLSVENN